MKAVTMYQTADGRVHESVEAARKHLDTLYGIGLTRLARDLIACEGKYGLTVELLDGLFQEGTRLKNLLDLKADTQVEAPDADD